MKKTILSLVALLLVFQNYAQINLLNEKQIPKYTISNVNSQNSQGIFNEIIWSEDFSNSDNENINLEDISSYGGWTWSTSGSQGMWSAGGSNIIESETPDNGFMIIDADFYNSYPQNNVENEQVGENPINASFSIGPIDLSQSPTEELSLQFYSNYRICCYNSSTGNNDLNVFIGKVDATGTISWDDLNYIEGDSYEINEEKETFSQIPLSGFSANVDSVYFKFEWIGTHYYWAIDDLSVAQRPEYDLRVKSGWIAMRDPENIEYYSIPVSQLPDSMVFGAEVYNYGYETDTVELNGMIDSESIYSSVSGIEIIQDTTLYIETTYFDVSNLVEGTYNFSVEVNSIGQEDDLTNNQYSRNFNIHPTKYAMGGLYENVDYYGTGLSGAGTFDGFRLANYFDIKQEATLSSILVDLSTGQEFSTSSGIYESLAGGEMIAYLCDTTGLSGEDPFGTDLGGIIVQSDFILITPTDIDNGYVVIQMDDFQLDEGAYYVAIEMYSNNGNNNIIIRDDKTVVQPSTASLMYNTDDNAWYTNPNAVGIELGLNGNITSTETNKMFDLKIFPNPSNKIIEIVSNEFLNKGLEVIIYNMTGDIVLNKNYDNETSMVTLDVSSINSGNYILELKNNDDIVHKKLVIN